MATCFPWSWGRTRAWNWQSRIFKKKSGSLIIHENVSKMMVFQVFSQNYWKHLLQFAYVNRQFCILSNAKRTAGPEKFSFYLLSRIYGVKTYKNWLFKQISWVWNICMVSLLLCFYVSMFLCSLYLCLFVSMFLLFLCFCSYVSLYFGFLCFDVSLFLFLCSYVPMFLCSYVPSYLGFIVSISLCFCASLLLCLFASLFLCFFVSLSPLSLWSLLFPCFFVFLLLFCFV